MLGGGLQFLNGSVKTGVIWKSISGRRTVCKSPGAGACLKVRSLSRVQLSATPWIVGYQAPQSREFSRQEYWVGCYFLLQRICSKVQQKDHCDKENDKEMKTQWRRGGARPFRILKIFSFYSKSNVKPFWLLWWEKTTGQQEQKQGDYLECFYNNPSKRWL